MILKPNISNIFLVKWYTASWTFPTPIFDIFIDALFTEHVPTPKQYALFVSNVTYRASETIFEMGNLRAQLFRREPGNHASSFRTG